MKKFLRSILVMVLFVPNVYANQDVAIVDLSQVVNSSGQVKILKQEHSKRMEELNKILVNARQEISKEQDQGKVLMLEERYTKEFNDKKNALEKEYMIKLNAIDKNIRDKIAKKAKESDYKYVFAKSIVLYGGEDITNSIIDDLSKN